MEIPAYCAKHVVNFLKSTKRYFRAYRRVNKRKVLLAKGWFNGTEMSGIPTTSLGNSLRAYSYAVTAIRVAKIPYNISHNDGEVKLYNAGDDLLINYREQYRHQLEIGLSTVYSIGPEQAMHGCG